MPGTVRSRAAETIGISALRSEPTLDSMIGRQADWQEYVDMKPRRKRLLLLAALSTGTLLASGCSDVAEQILATIRLALGIADVWV